jgi:hypothetical protein
MLQSMQSGCRGFTRSIYKNENGNADEGSDGVPCIAVQQWTLCERSAGLLVLLGDAAQHR